DHWIDSREMFGRASGAFARPTTTNDLGRCAAIGAKTMSRMPSRKTQGRREQRGILLLERRQKRKCRPRVRIGFLHGREARNAVVHSKKQVGTCDRAPCEPPFGGQLGEAVAPGELARIRSRRKGVHGRIIRAKRISPIESRSSKKRIRRQGDRLGQARISRLSDKASEGRPPQAGCRTATSPLRPARSVLRLSDPARNA